MYHLHRRLKLQHATVVAVLLGGVLVAWVLGSIVRHGIALAPDASGTIDGVDFWIFYVLFAIAVPFIFEATKNNHYDRWIGELSYPLYLVHGLVQGIFFIKFGARGDHVPTMLVALCCSVVAAIAMRLVVEQPIEAWRRRNLPRAVLVT